MTPPVLSRCRRPLSPSTSCRRDIGRTLRRTNTHNGRIRTQCAGGRSPRADHAEEAGACTAQSAFRLPACPAPRQLISMHAIIVRLLSALSDEGLHADVLWPRRAVFQRLRARHELGQAQVGPVQP